MSSSSFSPNSAPKGTVPQLASADPFGASQLKHLWWVAPLAVCAGLGTFGLYSTWAALQGSHYTFGPYLSPFYSPELAFRWWHFSPAILILWAPLGFRATCYYYRKAYYRAFFWDPPACAVSDGRSHGYSGETKFPFVLQNLHRYFLYVALVFIFFLWSDAVRGFWFNGHFGIGVGSLILVANSFLLTGYTLSCHAFRHLVGGKLDCFSCVTMAPQRRALYNGVSCINHYHHLWAWASLCVVGFSDFYIRMCSMGVWADFRIW